MVKPTSAAERVLTDLSVSSPRDLRQIELVAWARGAVVQRKHLDGAEARLVVLGERAIITVSPTVRDPRRERFSIAHELGHLEIHRWHTKLALCTDEDIDDGWRRATKARREQEANGFASALLLPERFFVPLCKDKDPSLELVAELADTFDVSLTATAIRYMHFCSEPCAIVFSKDGHIKWFEPSKEFGELGVFIDVRSRLDPASLAASFFQRGTVQATPKRVKASTWFMSGQYRDDAEIQEQSLAMPNYNAALTLLWVDEDIEEDDDLWWQVLSSCVRQLQRRLWLQCPDMSCWARR